MTNSNVTLNAVPRPGARRRGFRPFLKASLATVVAVLGGGFFTAPALGHQTSVSGVASCGASTYSITWTITNDYGLNETATVNSVTGGLATLSATSVLIT